MSSEGQTVRFRDCTCPGTPHNGRDGADDGDIVYLREHLGFSDGAEAYRKITDCIWETKGDVMKAMELMAERVGPVYLRAGPTGWNVVDAKGEPVPVNALDLPFHEALPIVDAASALYTAEISAPLAMRMNGQSGNGRIAKSTPPTIRSSSPRPSRSKRSSANGSAGKPSQVSP
jgi:hypothetical protein